MNKKTNPFRSKAVCVFIQYFVSFLVLHSSQGWRFGCWPPDGLDIFPFKCVESIEAVDWMFVVASIVL